MSNVPRQTFPDEAPTAPRTDFPSKTLIRMSRIDALAQRALERLMMAPSDDAVTAAVGDLCELRALVAEVL